MLLFRCTSFSAEAKLFIKLIWIPEFFSYLQPHRFDDTDSKNPYHQLDTCKNFVILHVATSHWVKVLNTVYERAVDDSSVWVIYRRSTVQRINYRNIWLQEDVQKCCTRCLSSHKEVSTRKKSTYSKKLQKVKWRVEDSKINTFLKSYIRFFSLLISYSPLWLSYE